ncbi:MULTISPECIES: STT3 domain-containing protein [Salinibaculum]|uniref:STT3 domain-containing protein n=1 Tax=Salinibaculum TaxID=2732368 RepID=UPI0030CDACB2
MTDAPESRLRRDRLQALPGVESLRRKRWLLGALGLVVAVRLLPAMDVFGQGTVVLSSNDPYAYRHAVEQFLSGDGAPWSLPSGVSTGEPLLVTTLWLVTVLLGGSQLVGDIVLALYPVAAAVVTAVLVYAIATRASEDSRVGLAAVLLLAVTPAHAYRTSLGFADHHAFDYLWLALTGYCLVVVLSQRERDETPWRYAAGLGVGIAGQALAWQAGPLLIVPVGLALAVTPVVRFGRDAPRLSLAPAVAGIGLGAVLVLLAHLLLGWHPISVPASVWLLFVGALGVLAFVESGQRWDISLPVRLAAAALVLGVVSLVVLTTLPDFVNEALSGIDRLFRQTSIGEMSSLIEDYGTVFGPLIILGFGFFLALIAVPVALRTARRRHDPSWLIVIGYTAHFGILALIQRRFAGELAPFLAVLAGFGFVVALAWLDILAAPAQLRRSDETPSAPVRPQDRARLSLLGGLSAVLLGTGGLYTTLINGRITIDPKAARTAQWIHDYASARGLTYPKNFVLSEWGRNRMYNYLVNGESASYAYARENYVDFLLSTDETAWYERFRDRVGFVVTRDFENFRDTPPSRLYARLHRHLGSAADGAGVGHYRAVYSSPEGAYKVFTLVPGATVTGTAPPAVDRITADLSIDGATFTYTRLLDPSDDGTFTVTLAQPGTYRLGERTVTVSEADVVDGTTITLD